MTSYISTAIFSGRTFPYTRISGLFSPQKRRDGHVPAEVVVLFEFSHTPRISFFIVRESSKLSLAPRNFFFPL